MTVNVELQRQSDASMTKLNAVLIVTSQQKNHISRKWPHKTDRIGGEVSIRNTHLKLDIGPKWLKRQQSHMADIKIGHVMRQILIS